jgi:nitronate monooxygenase
MALPEAVRQGLALPAVCAPMSFVSGPDLAREACKAGIIGAFPRHNAGSTEEFEAWLQAIRRDLDAHEAQGHTVAPLAVNATVMDDADNRRFAEACRKARVDIVISAFGDPTEQIKRVHEWGAIAIHDVTSMRFAEKAIRAGADGLVAIGAGGGGHSGTISHLAFIPRLRRIFDGIIVMAGAVTTGAAIRAAEILGADLAYLGTRFIASAESLAKPGYKELITRASAADLLYTPNPTGVSANWLKDSLRQFGLDPDNLPERVGPRGTDHYPAGVRSWRDFWSAGQGVELIEDVPPVAEICSRLRREYLAACAAPASFAEAARLAEEAVAAAERAGG